MINDVNQPGLFGLEHTNRDFTKKTGWGKNIFNATFPTALACYMGYKNLEPVYLCLDKEFKVVQRSITVEALFGLRELSPNLRFNFESDYLPYTQLADGRIPRIDLITVNSAIAQSLRALEIKLTVLPDNQTCTFSEDQYSSEIVVRPDTIVYVGLSIATANVDDRHSILAMLDPVCSRIKDWTDASEVRPLLGQIIKALDEVLLAKLDRQLPLVMQPVWKTQGKSSVLAENCLDIFVWSDLGLTRLFIDAARRSTLSGISRQSRAVIWLAKMLYDFAKEGRFAPRSITERLVYGPRNDKAFSITGKLTHSYMACEVLTRPRIAKGAIREIILGGGQNYLSPERRLDAIIVNDPVLFQK
jgi:hypothetical protein